MKLVSEKSFQIFFEGFITRNQHPTHSAPQSKNAVPTNIKHSRYIHLMSNFSSIHFHTKSCMYIMFNIVDTSFSYGRLLIVCSSLQEFSKTKESDSACYLKCRYCVFTLWGSIMLGHQFIWLFCFVAMYFQHEISPHGNF